MKSKNYVVFKFGLIFVNTLAFNAAPKNLHIGINDGNVVVTTPDDVSLVSSN